MQPNKPSTPLKLHSVKSSTIAAIGHDDISQILRVMFVSGTLYDYYGVGADLMQEFEAAESMGKYFAAHIKPMFECHKVEEVTSLSQIEKVIAAILFEYEASKEDEERLGQILLKHLIVKH